MKIIASVLSSVSHGGFGSRVHHGESRFVFEFFLVYLFLGPAFQICFLSLSMLFGETPDSCPEVFHVCSDIPAWKGVMLMSMWPLLATVGWVKGRVFWPLWDGLREGFPGHCGKGKGKASLA